MSRRRNRHQLFCIALLDSHSQIIRTAFSSWADGKKKKKEKGMYHKTIWTKREREPGAQLKSKRDGCYWSYHKKPTEVFNINLL